ncbi:MAG: ATP-dependent DNA helicase RecG [Elusimicrobiota bacterium]
MDSQALRKPVQFLKGVGPRRAGLLERLEISTVGDLLLRHLPRAWENRRETPPDRPPGEGPLVLRARVASVRAVHAGLHLTIFMADLKVPGYSEDIEAVWFKRPSRRFDVFSALKRDIRPGADLWIVGRAEPGALKLRKVSVEEYYRIEDPKAAYHVGRIVPVYSLTEGLTQRFLRETVAGALDSGVEGLREPLPPEILQKRELLSLPQAIPAAHFPRSGAELEEARRRLAFDELLLLELAWTIKHRQTREVSKGYGYEIKRTLLTPMRERLGFELTDAQKRVINEIFEDMRSKSPMTRLLQGDVGSGKTVVALAAMLLAVENGAQAAFMAPTEILAEQHMWTFERFLHGMGVRFALLSSRVPPKQRQKTLEAARAGELDIVVGTHALLEGDVTFPRLRLAVIDEQHRFGVRQRTTLRRKGPPMDLLLMTATPIPRTLALALYGDLDVSTIDEMPPGRRPASTAHVSETQAFETVRREAAAGHQSNVVYPIIEESASLDHKAAIAEHERLRAQAFPGLRVGLVHGRMPGKKKVAVMEEFSKGLLDVLVATPVIEVGVDVPNAAVMVVQNADRFGLASLHQLRGRIGRGKDASFCCLVASPNTDQARKRLSILCETSDGFRIGEEDLKIRGPGDALGTAQHGDLTLKAADLFKDADLLAAAKEDAEALLAVDPDLTRPEHHALRERLALQYQERWHSIDLA